MLSATVCASSKPAYRPITAGSAFLSSQTSYWSASALLRRTNILGAFSIACATRSTSSASVMAAPPQQSTAEPAASRLAAHVNQPRDDVAAQRPRQLLVEFAA